MYVCSPNYVGRYVLRKKLAARGPRIRRATRPYHYPYRPISYYNNTAEKAIQSGNFDSVGSKIRVSSRHRPYSSACGEIRLSKFLFLACRFHNRTA